MATIWFGVSATTWACESRTPPKVTVADLAGVTITTTTDARRTFATVDPSPLLEIGGSDERGPAQLNGIQDVWMDADERLWVVDGGSAEVRVFGPDGSHVMTVGRRGEGPGEFLRPRLLGGSEGGEVIVWDQGNARLTTVDEGGDVARTVALETGERAPPKGYAVYRDGSLLVQFPRVVRPPPPGTLLQDTTRLERMVLPSGASDLQVQVAGPSWVWTGSHQVPVPFTANPALTLEGSWLHLASGPEFEITVVEDGTVREVYGVDRPPRTVERRDVDGYVVMTERMYAREDARNVLTALDHPARPTVLPAYSDLVLADDGRIWARVYSVDPVAMGEWDVFDEDRSWLGRVVTPVGLRVLQVVDSRLVGVWYDNLGVEHVRLHEYRTRELP